MMLSIFNFTSTHSVYGIILLKKLCGLTHHWKAERKFHSFSRCTQRKALQDSNRRKSGGQFGDWVTPWNSSSSSRTCGQWRLGHKILKTILPSLFYLSGRSQGNRLFPEQRICEDLDNLTLPFQQVKSSLLHQTVLRGPCCDLRLCLCTCLRWWAGGFYKPEHPWRALRSS